MRTIELKLYKAKELSEVAQAAAHQQYLSIGMEFYQGEDYIMSLRKGLKAFDCRLDDYRIEWGCKNRSHVKWTLTANGSGLGYGEDNKVLNMKGLRLHKYIINHYECFLTENKPVGKYISERRNYQMRNKAVRVATQCPFTGVTTDESFLEPIRNFMDKPTMNTTFEDLIDSAVENLLSDAEKEYEYTLSLQYFLEMAEANEWEYTAIGKQY